MKGKGMLRRESETMLDQEIEAATIDDRTLVPGGSGDQAGDAGQAKDGSVGLELAGAAKGDPDLGGDYAAMLVSPARITAEPGGSAAAAVSVPVTDRSPIVPGRAKGSYGAVDHNTAAGGRLDGGRLDGGKADVSNPFATPV